VAFFELHKDAMPAEAIGKILQGHLDQVVPYYTTQPTEES
ncbi:MAG: hypothetical protein ACJAUA_000634, partial [Zhongshania aliphaticivorans]